MSDDKKYIYKIYTEDGILKFEKYLIIYQGFSYEEDCELVYYVDELSYYKYIEEGSGSNELIEIAVQDICSLINIKQDYLNYPHCHTDWYRVYCCDTNEDELNTELPKWQKIRNDTKEQRESDEKERIRQRKIERKQYILNQISENQNNIINLNSKIKTVNDEYIKDMTLNLINRLEKENEGLSNELDELLNI